VRQLNRLFRIVVFHVGVVIAAIASAQSPDDPYLRSSSSWDQTFADQWALESLRIYADITQASAGGAQASAGSTQAHPVVVAVIDTGMDYQHPDFAAERLWHNEQETPNGYDDDDNGFVDDLIGWNFVANNNNPWDQSGHGTHIAGIIAACTDNGLGIAAVNGDAQIMPLKVANFIGQARSSAVAAAIFYAVDHGARVINLSLGSELVTDLERSAAEYARDHDVLIVVSAGNKGSNLAYSGYASLPGVLIVGASDTDGERAGFSNFGSKLMVLAPGVDILSLRARDTDFISLTHPLDYSEGSAIVGEDGHYYRASGTSFSAALVSGLASRLIADRPDIGATDLQHLITQSAHDVGVEGVDQTSGYGRVDYVRALASDPGSYISARLVGVDLSLRDEQVWISVGGVADASNFAGAELMVRAAPGSILVVESEDKKRKKKRGKEEPEGPSPYDWQPLGSGFEKPIKQGVLGSINLKALHSMTGGSTSWELRLIVHAQSGAHRESRMAIALPVPAETVASATGTLEVGRE
jgi:subtilisin family serine protease